MFYNIENIGVKETFIINFLDKNYKIIGKYSNLILYDKYNEVNLNEFNQSFMDIFHWRNYSIYNEWSYTKKTKIKQYLNNILYGLDYSKGGIRAMAKFKIKLNKDLRFRSDFLTNYFNEYYRKNILIPKLKKIVENFDKTKSSRDLLLEYNDPYYKAEREYTYDFIRKLLINWYGENVIQEKINNILNEVKFTNINNKYDSIYLYRGEKFDNLNLFFDFLAENEYHVKNLISDILNKWLKK